MHKEREHLHGQPPVIARLNKKTDLEQTATFPFTKAARPPGTFPKICARISSERKGDLRGTNVGGTPRQPQGPGAYGQRPGIPKKSPPWATGPNAPRGPLGKCLEFWGALYWPQIEKVNFSFTSSEKYEIEIPDTRI